MLNSNKGKENDTRITIVQSDIAWANVAANHRYLEELITNVSDADLIVLPEMFSTGFAMEPEGVAEEQGESARWMQKIAERKGCAVAGSVSVKEGNRFYNRMYFVSPTGVLAQYDKRHLFTFGGEKKAFTAGNERVVAEWRGVRYLLQICYDLRFPVFSRNQADYDVAIYVANWPEGRQQAWDTLLRARAIENQCFVVGVNRVGAIPACRYRGGSSIIDFQGTPLAACPDYKEAMASANLNMKRLQAFRKSFPVLEDRD